MISPFSDRGLLPALAKRGYVVTRLDQCLAADLRGVMAPPADPDLFLEPVTPASFERWCAPFPKDTNKAVNVAMM